MLFTAQIDWTITLLAKSVELEIAAMSFAQKGVCVCKLISPFRFAGTRRVLAKLRRGHPCPSSLITQHICGVVNINATF